MRITTLSAQNVKIPCFRHDLSAVTVLVGSNFVGKSARLDALRLGLLGFVPGLPRTNAGIFNLSCGKEMSVELRLSNGKKIERKFVAKDGSINRIETGTASVVIPDVLLDCSTYLNASQRERDKMVFGMVQLDNDKWSGERVLKTIGDTPIDCDTNTIEKVVAIKKEIFDDLSVSDHRRHANDESIQAWLEVVLNDLRDQSKDTAAALAKLQKYQESAIDLRWAGHTKASEVEPPNVEKQIAEKSAELQKLREQIAVAESKSQQAQQVERMRAELKRALAEPDPSPAIKTLKKQLQEVEPLSTKPVVGLQEVASKLSDAKGRASVAQSVLKRIQSESDALRSQYVMDVKLPKCPRCHRGGKGFQDAIQAHFKEAKSALQAESDKATAELGRALKEATEFQMQYDAAVKADRAAQDNAFLFEKLKSELVRLEQVVKTRADWQNQLDELASIESPEGKAIAEMSVTATTLVGELSILDAKQKAWVTSQHEQKRHAEARAQMDQMVAELLVLKALAKSVESIQSVMVADTFGSILSDANRFCDGILLTPLAYHEGEIGRWSDKNWVPHRSFSDTEKLISGTGISVALAQQSPIKIVLLDELGRLTVENKTKLVEKLVSLTSEGFLDQTICVDVDATPYQDISGLNLIEIIVA